MLELKWLTVRNPRKNSSYAPYFEGVAINRKKIAHLVKMMTSYWTVYEIRMNDPFCLYPVAWAGWNIQPMEKGAITEYCQVPSYTNEQVKKKKEKKRVHL